MTCDICKDTGYVWSEGEPGSKPCPEGCKKPVEKEESKPEKYPYTECGKCDKRWDGERTLEQMEAHSCSQEESKPEPCQCYGNGSKPCVCTKEERLIKEADKASEKYGEAINNLAPKEELKPEVCQHGIYPNRCVDCGAEPLNASTQLICTQKCGGEFLPEEGLIKELFKLPPEGYVMGFDSSSGKDEMALTISRVEDDGTRKTILSLVGEQATAVVMMMDKTEETRGEKILSVAEGVMPPSEDGRKNDIKLALAGSGADIMKKRIIEAIKKANQDV